MRKIDHLRNAALSAGRVFAAAALALWISKGAEPPSHLDLADLRTLLDAGLAALLLTAANALRKGETTFGRGASE